jgi:hypothetical protein
MILSIAAKWRNASISPSYAVGVGSLHPDGCFWHGVRTRGLQGYVSPCLFEPQMEETTMLGMKKKSKLDAAVKESHAIVRKSGAALSAEVDNLLGTLADKVADARGAISTLSEDSAAAASQALDKVVKSTKKGVKQLDKKWQKMDTKQKVAVVGGLLAVLAAAAATPTIVKKVKARK